MCKERTHDRSTPQPPGLTTTENLPTVTRRLAFLVLVTILPVLVFSAFMIVRCAQEQRVQYQQQLQATAHATSLAVDAELSRRLAILTTLRNSRELKDRDWQAFHDLAEVAVADEPSNWATLYEPSGQIVLTTLVPYGAVLPETAAPETVRRVVETRQFHVSNLFTDSVSQAFFAAVYIPVIENDSVMYVLGLGAPPASISRILQSQIQTGGWVAAIFDRNGMVVARSRNEKEYDGHSAVPQFREAMRHSDQGSLEVRNLEGLLVSSVFTKSALSGWSTELAVEKSALDAQLWWSLRIFGIGGGLLSVMALLLATCLGRRFAALFAALAATAESLGRGERLPRSILGLREAQTVADQMILAADTLRHHDDEHGHLLARLNNSNERLAAANKELESFAYSVSHDLRAPLRAIDGFSHVLQEDYADKLDEEALRLIQIIRDGVMKMARLIDDILAFARTSRREMAPADIDMTGLVQTTLNDLAPAMTGRTIEMKVASATDARRPRNDAAGLEQSARQRDQVHRPQRERADRGRLVPGGGKHRLLREGQRCGFRHGLRRQAVRRVPAAACSGGFSRHRCRARHRQVHRRPARRPRVGRGKGGRGRGVLFRTAVASTRAWLIRGALWRDPRGQTARRVGKPSGPTWPAVVLRRFRKGTSRPPGACLRQKPLWLRLIRSWYAAIGIVRHGAGTW
jgi:signal transduction histidine kinase